MHKKSLISSLVLVLVLSILFSALPTHAQDGTPTPRPTPISAEDTLLAQLEECEVTAISASWQMEDGQWDSGYIILEGTSPPQFWAEETISSVQSWADLEFSVVQQVHFIAYNAAGHVMQGNWPYGYVNPYMCPPQPPFSGEFQAEGSEPITSFRVEATQFQIFAGQVLTEAEVASIYQHNEPERKLRGAHGWPVYLPAITDGSIMFFTGPTDLGYELRLYHTQPEPYKAVIFELEVGRLYRVVVAPQGGDAESYVFALLREGSCHVYTYILQSTGGDFLTG